MYQKRKICLILILAFLSSTISFAQIGGWISQESGTDAYLTDVYFVNPDTGWITGHGVILNTVDGGENWSLQDSIDVYFKSVFFTDANQGWAVGFKSSGASGIIYHTADGGENWDLNDSSRFDLNDICFINPDTGYVVGGVGGNITILRTTNAGVEWEEMDASGGALFTVQFINDTLGWAAGDRGKLLKTEDGGSTWTTSFVNMGAFPIQSLSFANPDTGWVVGLGRMYKTVNGGETWEAQDCDGNTNYSSCFFKDSNSGWIVATGPSSLGEIFFTEDGGNSWLLQKTMEAKPLKSIFFLDDSTAWCIGWYGTILKATSQGIVSIRDNGPAQNEPSQANGLHQNYPNPFSFETTLSYTLRESGPVRMAVYNLHGEEVAVLVDKNQVAGTYALIFDGRGLTSGIYYYQLRNARGVSVKKMQVIK